MANALKLANALGMKKLINGVSPETSGGLLIAISPENAAEFCTEISQLEQIEAWIVGRVEEGPRGAELVAEPQVIEVPFVKK